MPGIRKQLDCISTIEVMITLSPSRSTVFPPTRPLVRNVQSTLYPKHVHATKLPIHTQHLARQDVDDRYGLITRQDIHTRTHNRRGILPPQAHFENPAHTSLGEPLRDTHVTMIAQHTKFHQANDCPAHPRTTPLQQPVFSLPHAYSPSRAHHYTKEPTPPRLRPFLSKNSPSPTHAPPTPDSGTHP